MKITVEEIAKVIAGNYVDWKSYTGKAQKVLDLIKSKREKDLFSIRH